MRKTPDINQLKAILIEAAKTQIPSIEESKKLICDTKSDGSIVTQIDANLQNSIEKELLTHWPHIPLLGEEMSQDEQLAMIRHSKAGLWVLDPLDGTTNFTTGLPLFGLSLAFVQNGVTQMAVIYDPNRDECFSASRGNGAYLNEVKLLPIQGDDLAACIANIDYKRLTAALSSHLVARPPYRSQRNIGSCVLEWCWLAAGRFQLYLHGGQHLWDHAAGRLILEEAGGVATRLDRTEMLSSKLIKQSAIAASNEALYQAWIDWIEQAK